MEPNHTSIPVVILAGGQSNRLQIGNKLKWQLPFHHEYSSDSNRSLTKLLDNPLDSILTHNNMLEPIFYEHSQSLLAFIIERLKLQTNCILINGPFTENSELKKHKLPIISDQLPDFQGPLSGILTALHWAKQQESPWVATVSCDTPFFPENLLHSLSKSLLDNARDTKKRAAIAAYKKRTHPTFGLWSVELYETLKKYIELEQSRALNRWALLHAKTVEFKESTFATKSLDPFFNINLLDDYKEALSYLKP